MVVIAGKDKGKQGTVERVLPKRDTIVVAGVNVQKKHMRSMRDGKKGSIVDRTMPIHVSNAMVLDPKEKKQTRTTRTTNKVGKTVRVTKKSNTEL